MVIWPYMDYGSTPLKGAPESHNASPASAALPDGGAPAWIGLWASAISRFGECLKSWKSWVERLECLDLSEKLGDFVSWLEVLKSGH